ncbi:MAG: hypothetical protein QOI92_446 [Chloroflexota bacterium]|nr:hypothetical protein [Chloroflexota bacterium]
MTDYTDRELLALDQIEDLLRAYADARLAPATPVLARMRAAVMGQAVISGAVAAEQHRIDTDRAIGRRWALPGFQLPRRAMAFGLAASLTLGTTAAVFAAPPGSPFYSARITIENALVPNNPDARLAAHEDRLTELLADAQAAANSGNGAALDAALAAYQDEVDAAVADLGDAPDRLAHLEEDLGKHVAVLQGLEATLPTQAAIEHAIDASQKAINKLHDSGSHPGGKPSPAPHPTHVPATPGPDASNHSGGNS